jgi:hypothetical protein
MNIFSRYCKARPLMAAASRQHFVAEVVIGMGLAGRVNGLWARNDATDACATPATHLHWKFSHSTSPPAVAVRQGEAAGRLGASNRGTGALAWAGFARGRVAAAATDLRTDAA